MGVQVNPASEQPTIPYQAAPIYREEHAEGRVTRVIEQQAAKLPFGAVPRRLAGRDDGVPDSGARGAPARQPIRRPLARAAPLDGDLHQAGEGPRSALTAAQLGRGVSGSR